MESIQLKEFKKRIKKVSSPRKHRVKNSLGIRDAFLYLQSHKWLDIGQSILEPLFQHIVRDVNNLLAMELVEGRGIIFPESMGELEIRKKEHYVKFQDGKIKTNYMIDWDSTLNLWYEDAEARKNKTLVRKIGAEEFYGIFYNRSSANYNNKSYMTFKPNRSVVRVLTQNTKKGHIDAFRYGTKTYQNTANS